MCSRSKGGRKLGEKSMIKKFANALMALTMAAGMTFAAAPQAEAARGVVSHLVLRRISVLASWGRLQSPRL